MNTSQTPKRKHVKKKFSRRDQLTDKILNRLLEELVITNPVTRRDEKENNKNGTA